MTDIPVIGIPLDPTIKGLKLFTQVYMYNPTDYPLDWVMTSIV